jgi:hypothetical protein
MPTLSDAHQLLQLADLTRDSVHRIIAEWAKVPAASPGKQGGPVDDGEANLPSRELFEAQRTLVATTGKLVELISDPSSRLLEVSSQYNESRCLHIAAVLRIPDLLAENGDEGMSMERIAEKVGIETRKLGMSFPDIRELAVYLNSESHDDSDGWQGVSCAVFARFTSSGRQTMGSLRTMSSQPA